jgi:hypothetical protein
MARTLKSAQAELEGALGPGWRHLPGAFPCELMCSIYPPRYIISHA